MCSKPGKARHWALLLGFQQAHQQQGTVAVSCDPWQQVQGPKRCTAGDFHMELSNRNRPEMMGSDGLMMWLMAYDFCEREKMFCLKTKNIWGETKSGKLRLQGENKFANGTRYSNLFSQKCSVPRNQESVKISSSTSSPANKHNLDTAGFTQG